MNVCVQKLDAAARRGQILLAKDELEMIWEYLLRTCVRGYDEIGESESMFLEKLKCIFPGKDFRHLLFL